MIDRQVFTWYSERLERRLPLVRWGHYGQPVLAFATAGGDPEEIERWQMIGALSGLIEAGRIKVYSVDSTAGRTWIDRRDDPLHGTWIQDQYDGYIAREVVPAIRADCRSPEIEVIATGASIGAFNALASLCRHPDLFRAAICMSGSYNLEDFVRGHFTERFYFCSPWHFLPNLGEGRQLDLLRRRFALLAVGQGRWEDPGETWHMAGVLGAKGIPNRVDAWGPEWDHDWPTWRQMLPHYLDELTR